MKVLSMIVMGLFVVTTTQTSFAHTSHSHASKKEIAKERAENLARSEIKRLIESEKIEKSWAKASLLESKKTSAHWLSTFKNDSAQDKSKNTLYVYVKLNGENIKATFEK